jgi:hypothetical protein
MFLAYGLLLVLGYILGAIVLGFLIEKYVFRKQTLTLTGVALGVVIFTILPEVPFIGGLLVFALTIIALGGLGILCYRSARG